jgi:hypothetical protein
MEKQCVVTEMEKQSAVNKMERLNVEEQEERIDEICSSTSSRSKVLVMA